jgi:DivIVA domain-containing protein
VVTLYLSYPAADRDRARDLAAGLRTAGHTVRTDHQSAGDSGWWSSILTAVADADAFLYATSTDATVSPAVALQRDYALSRGLPVIAIRLSRPRASSAESRNSAQTSQGDGVGETGQVEQLGGQAGQGGGQAGRIGGQAGQGGTEVGQAGQVVGQAGLGGGQAGQVVGQAGQGGGQAGQVVGQAGQGGGQAGQGGGQAGPGGAEAGQVGGQAGQGGSAVSAQGLERGWPREAVVDFAKADADAAFALIGAIAALSFRGRAAGGGFPPAGDMPTAAGEALRTESDTLTLAGGMLAPAGDMLRAEGDTLAPAGDMLTAKGDTLTAAGDTLTAKGDTLTAKGDTLTAKAGTLAAEGEVLTVEAVRGAGFHRPSTSWLGYDERGVDEFLDVVEQDLRARQDARSGVDAPGVRVSVNLTAEDVRAVRFARPPSGRRGYDQDEVDSFLQRVERSFSLLDAELGRRGATVAKR